MAISRTVAEGLGSDPHATVTTQLVPHCRSPWVVAYRTHACLTLLGGDCLAPTNPAPDSPKHLLRSPHAVTLVAGSTRPRGRFLDCASAEFAPGHRATHLIQLGVGPAVSTGGDRLLAFGDTECSGGAVVRAVVSCSGKLRPSDPAQKLGTCRPRRPQTCCRELVWPEPISSAPTTRPRRVATRRQTVSVVSSARTRRCTYLRAEL